MERKISDNVTNTTKKKKWECECGASGVVNEYTQALLCGSCGEMVREFALVELLTEPAAIPGDKLNE